MTTTTIPTTKTEIDLGSLPELATRKEVAKWAAVSDRQVDILAAKGSFPKPIRVGTHPRWTRSSLLRWLQQQSEMAEA